jgi:hypothetical protein
VVAEGGDEGGGGVEGVVCRGRAGMMSALGDVAADVVDGVCVLLGV